MIKPLLKLYQTISDNRDKFTSKGLSGDFFIDVYRSQPLNPELHEYFSLPAIFVDYSMTGQGRNKRIITLTLHIITDEFPDASNISEQVNAGLNRFLYLTVLQSILEGIRLGDTTPLVFLTESIFDANVINYHIQSYEFEMSLSSMVDDIEFSFGEFEKLDIYGSLRGR